MKKISIASWGILFFLYCLKIFLSYINLDFDSSFGYLDHQLYWQTLLDFLQGKALYKNIFWEYSLLPILIRLPFFILLQKSFFASTFINLVIIPIIGIILSFYIGKQLLGKKALLLFGLLLLFMGTNTNYSSIRYLIPELGFLMLIMGMEKGDEKKTLIGSIVMGISLLTSVEYAVSSQIGLIVYFFSLLIVRKKISKKQWLQLLIIELLVGSAFFIYLLSNNAFQNFMRFHIEYLKSFYSESPCRDTFPRWHELGGIKSRPIETLARWNYYFVPFIMLAMGVWLFFKKDIRFKMLLMILVIYSLLVSYRTLTTPCYYSYGMTYPFLILSYLIFQTQVSRRVRRILIGIAIWFILTSTQFNLITLISQQPWRTIHYEEKEFLPVANIFLSKNLTEEYNAIAKYIQAHTHPEEYVYTHRVGPYNQLAKRKSPVSVASSSVYEAAPFLVDLTVSELQQHPPSYVIINTYNGDSYSNSVRNIRANVHRAGDVIIFEGDTTEVENYISRYYMVDKVYNLAWILKRRSTPIKLIQYYIPISEQGHWSIGSEGLERKINATDSLREYRITKRNPTITVLNPEIKHAEHIEIPIQINLGSIKPVSKFNLKFFLITNAGQMIHLNNNAISSDWSNQWIYIPRKELLPKGIEIVGVIMLVSDNEGFFPWGRPYSIKLNLPKLYIKNPQIGPTIRGYKKNY